MYRVLQVTPQLNAGGVERTTVEMAEAISRAGGLALVASAGGRLEPELKAAGGELLRLPVNSKNPLTVWANASKLAAFARAHDVNIIHARSRAPAWSAMFAAHRLRVPFVTTYHGIYNGRTRLKRFYNSVMAKGDVVIANSEYTRRHVLAQYKLPSGRVVAIPRGVDLSEFEPNAVSPARIAEIRKQWGVREGQLAIIAPARLTRWKGQLVLIEAAGRLSERRPHEVKLIFAGDAQGRTDYVHEMMDSISARGLQEDVAILGHMRNIAEALAASDGAVFPSTDPEAFGRGAIEAGAMGLPVIAAGHGGLAETVIDGSTGMLTGPGNPVELEAALERLVDMGAAGRSAMGARGRAHVTQKFTKEAMQQATLKVYDHVLGLKPGVSG